MHRSWMLITTAKKTLLIFYLFIYLIFKKINNNWKNENFFLLLKLKKFFNKNTFYSNCVNDNLKFFIKLKKTSQDYLNDYAHDIPDKVLFRKNFSLKNNTQFNFCHTSSSFLSFNKKFYLRLLQFFFLNSFLSYSLIFARTGFFRMFFYRSTKSAPYLIDLNKVLTRWVDFFNLSLNLYLLKINPLVYSSPFFKNETLSLNWSTNSWDINSWKYIYPYFIFKINHFSQETSFFYKKLKQSEHSFFVVSDCLYHYKNLYFFKKNNFYTLGLVSLNMNPWIVFYPVLASSNSYINQIFFLQSLVYSKKKSLLLYFFIFKKLWNTPSLRFL